MRGTQDVDLEVDDITQASAIAAQVGAPGAGGAQAACRRGGAMWKLAELLRVVQLQAVQQCMRVPLLS